MTSKPANPPKYRFFIDGNNFLWLGSSTRTFEVRHSSHPRKCFTCPVRPKFAAVLAVMNALRARDDSEVILYFDSTAQKLLTNWRDFQGDQSKRYPKGEDLTPIWDELMAFPPEIVCVQKRGGFQADDPMLSDANAALHEGYEVFLLTGDKFNKPKDGHRQKYPLLLETPLNSRDQPRRCLKPGWSDAKHASPAAIFFSNFPTLPPQWDAQSGTWVVDYGSEWRLTVDQNKILDELKSRPAEAKTTPPITVISRSVAEPPPVPSQKLARAATRLVAHEFVLAAPGLLLRGDLKTFKTNATKALVEAAIPDANRVIDVGRDDSADVVVSETERLHVVSRKHLRITLDSITGWYQATDLGSTNGTWLNETLLPPSCPLTIPEGEGVFCFASRSDPDAVVQLYYQHDPLPITTTPVGERAPTRLVQSDAAKSVSAPQRSVRPARNGSAKRFLLCVEPERGGPIEKFEIDALPFEIGRLDLAASTQGGARVRLSVDSLVSRTHLRLTSSFELQHGAVGFQTEQLGRNATEHEGRRYGEKEEFVLRVGGPAAILAPDDSICGRVKVWILE